MADWYSGEDSKILVELTTTGFDMDTDAWHVDIYSDKKKMATFNRSNCARDDNGKYYIPLNSDLLRPGTISAVATAELADDDFEGGVRRLVEKVIIGKCKKPIA